MCSPPATRAFLFVSALLLIAPALVTAQESKGTQAAGAEIARGKTALETKDYRAAQIAFAKAIELDPAFAPAYATLARIAGARGDVKTQLDFLRKASEAAPDTPSYLQSYISALWPVDPGTARALSLQMAGRFPSEPATAQVLFNLAAQSDDMSEKIAGLERLRRRPGPVLQSANGRVMDLFAGASPWFSVPGAHQEPRTRDAHQEPGTTDRGPLFIPTV